jgi:hypothetical protein
MQTNQNVPRPFYTLSQAIAYLLGGIFLFNNSSIYLAGTPGALIGQIFGGLFMGFAFFLAISSFIDKLVEWANRINKCLFLALFFTAMASLYVTVAKATENLTLSVVLALAFSVVVIVAMLFRTREGLRTELRKLGPRVVLTRSLGVISFVLGVFALAMVIMQVNIMGGPILHLAISLVCLGAAFLLQRTA